MRKKSIAIVGAGNAGCVTAMHYRRHGRNDIDKITIYYDPESPMEMVGQGASPLIPKLIFETFQTISWHNQAQFLKARMKCGTLFEGWGKRTKEIIRPMPLDQVSLHYIPKMLSKLILDSGLFEVVEKKITDPEKEIDSDFIFDCRGRHGRDPNLYEDLITPLNSVFLGGHNEPDITQLYTKVIATQDGWTFVVPTYEEQNYGYLFNKEVTPKEKAKENMAEMFGIEPHTSIDFQSYIAKDFFCGERTFLNGNRLSFLEPLEATATTFYVHVAKCAWDHIVFGLDKKQCNQNVRNEMKKIETFILWHYQFGSKYDTPFWEYARSLPFQPDENFTEIVAASLREDFNEVYPTLPMYAQWGPRSFKGWLDRI